MVFDGIVRGRSESAYRPGKISIDIRLTEEDHSWQSFTVHIDKGAELDQPIGTKVQIGIQLKPETMFASVQRAVGLKTNGN